MSGGQAWKSCHLFFGRYRLRFLSRLLRQARLPLSQSNPLDASLLFATSASSFSFYYPCPVCSTLFCSLSSPLLIQTYSALPDPFYHFPSPVRPPSDMQACQPASAETMSPQHEHDSHGQRTATATATAERARSPLRAARTPLPPTPSERLRVVPDRHESSEPEWIFLRRFDLGMVLRENRSLRRDKEQVRSEFSLCHDRLLILCSKLERSNG
jgi:hypothetical protein